MSANISPVIAGIKIRVNEDGLFNLNDLHQAAGGEKRHRPNYFIENERTQRLIVRLKETVAGEPIRILTGSQGGTFVHKDLVYTYAMWISDDFHLQVVRTFDAVARGDLEAALSEKDKAQLALLRTFQQNPEKYRKNPRSVDYSIALLLKDTATVERIERQEAAEEDWRQNTAVGYVSDKLAKIGPGFDFVLKVPSNLNVEDVRKEVVALLKQKNLKGEIVDWGDGLKIETW